jgi:Neocarzinostatin family
MIDLRYAIRVGLTLAACSALTVSCGGSTTGSSSSSSTTTPKTHMATPVQSGFGQDEDFCAQRPLHGTIEYRASRGNVTMEVQVKGLPSKSLVLIDWANNTVRGYEVGSFATDTSGTSIPSSLNLFRPGETRGYKIVLTTTAIDATTLGTLWPCGPPHFVTPGTGLTDGQGVNVSVSGFGESGKVFLSECDHAEDANVLGCGPQLAAQPFIITGTDRSGSATFVVHGTAASKPYDTTSVTPCSALCVIVATQGDGAWAVAPIAFGS